MMYVCIHTNSRLENQRNCYYVVARTTTSQLLQMTMAIFLKVSYQVQYIFQ